MIWLMFVCRATWWLFALAPAPRRICRESPRKDNLDSQAEKVCGPSADEK